MNNIRNTGLFIGEAANIINELFTDKEAEEANKKAEQDKKLEEEKEKKRLEKEIEDKKKKDAKEAEEAKDKFFIATATPKQPDKKPLGITKFTGHMMCLGNTNAGKTTWVITQIAEKMF
jgi:flagellar biosynthesis GTPase FlhF